MRGNEQQAINSTRYDNYDFNKEKISLGVITETKFQGRRESSGADFAFSYPPCGLRPPCCIRLAARSFTVVTESLNRGAHTIGLFDYGSHVLHLPQAIQDRQQSEQLVVAIIALPCQAGHAVIKVVSERAKGVVNNDNTRERPTKDS